MDMSNASALVTGGASGLGLGTVTHFVEAGIPTVMVDLPTSDGARVSAELGDLVTFVPADITSTEEFETALDAAERIAPLRAVVHCAARTATMRVLDKAGDPSDIDVYEGVIKTNLVGSYNVLRLTAARMVKSAPVGEERGVIILTASVAAWEGQIGQMPYASSKAGIVGMTLPAARDLARKQVRVNAIAPGIFNTPGLGRHSQEVLDGLAAQVPHPSRMGAPAEFGHLAHSIVENPMINGETIRIDGAIRMSAR